MSANNPPPVPVEGRLVVSYLKTLVGWLRKNRARPGVGVDLTQTEGGITYSLNHGTVKGIMDEYVGTALTEYFGTSNWIIYQTAGTAVVLEYGTAAGSVLITGAAGDPEWLSAGTAGDVLVMGTAGAPEWETPGVC